MAENYQFETRCIHGDGGFVEEHPYGAVSVPIFQTATFAHPGIGKSTGYDYSRESNPTRYELESVMSSTPLYGLPMFPSCRNTISLLNIHCI